MIERNDIRGRGVVRRSAENVKGKGWEEGQKRWNAAGRNVKKDIEKNWDVGQRMEHGREECRDGYGKRRGGAEGRGRGSGGE